LAALLLQGSRKRPAALLAGSGLRGPAALRGMASTTVRLRQPRVSARFSRTRSWVCFSDLHLTAATQAVAMQVLERVHAEAAARDAGVLFLGDFWHHRGKLPVEPLNAAVEVFSSWRCPTIMLTGNHDQVSIGGQLHALNALAAAAPRGLVKVVAEPTVLLGALWLPYRRRQEELRRAIALSERAAQKKGKSLRTIFCHADLQGAAFNDSFQAAAGLPLSIFPNEAAVWSGHYHKPQVLGGQLGDPASPAYVEYVGSPLELSFAEEAQAKRLLLFARQCSGNGNGNGGAWQRTGEIALAIGPRHFSLEGEELAKRLALAAGRGCSLPGGGITAGGDGDVMAEAVSAAAAAAAAGGGGVARPGGAPKPGDRVRIMLDARPSAAAEAACEAALAALQASAVDAKLMRRPAAAAARIEGTASMSPPTLLAAFHAAQGRLLSLDNEDARVVADRERTLVMAQAMLRAVADESDVAVLAAPDRVPVHVVLDRVVVRGFGPFLAEVSYPLRERGVRLVTGNSGGRVGSDGLGSNGAGKTALVMAPLWALSGETDPRPDGRSTRGLGGADVIHHAAKEAAVRLEGTANGEEFVVERTVGKRSRRLSFIIGGVDYTGQDLALTQAEIDERLVPASLLREVAFHGQHVMSTGSLIDATDKEVKAAMGRLVHMGLWELLHSRAQRKGRAVQEAVVATRAEGEELARFVHRLEAECEQAGRRLAAWESGRVEALERALVEADEARASAGEAAAALAAADVGVQAAVQHAKTVAAEALAADAASPGSLAQRSWFPSSVDAAAAAAADDDDDDDDAASLEAEYLAAVEAVRACDVEHARVSSEERSWLQRVDRALGVGSVDQQAECELCLQPIDPMVLAAGRQSLRDGAVVAAVERARLEEEGRQLRAQANALHLAVAQARADADAQLIARAQEAAAASAATDLVATAVERGQLMIKSLHRARVELLSAHGDAQPLTEGLGAAAGEMAITAASVDGGGGDSWAKRAQAAAANVDHASMAAQAQAERAYGVARALASSTERLAAINIIAAEEDSDDLDGGAQRGEAARLRQRLAEEKQALGTNALRLERLRSDSVAAATLSDTFGRGGIQSYVLDEALSQLQARTASILEEISGGALTLALSATSEAKSGKKGRALQRISREISVRLADGSMVRRSVRQCSGGERRRVALALALGFGELAAERSGVSLDLLVLDEALQQMDEEGMQAAARMFQRLDRGTVLVVCQANSAISGMFGAVDTVVKEGDVARVETG
jgi:DNA repair exonuclease SbcCD ATPase subunit